ncbi:4-alpha-glucanotransferase [Yersinia enterocolitica]|nr:4-alpha-glucanotransferase [Yersinia enterocolitica]
MDRKSLDQAATLAGIAANYINAHGKSQAISAQTKQQLLAAMGRTSVPPRFSDRKSTITTGKNIYFWQRNATANGGIRRLSLAVTDRKR